MYLKYIDYSVIKIGEFPPQHIAYKAFDFKTVICV